MTTKYNQYGQPTEISKALNELGLNLPFNKDTPYSYGTKELEFQYDNVSHSLNSIKPADKLQFHYLWGYKKGYPVAEISGVTFESIMNILQQGGFDLHTLEESTSDAYIESATSYIRDHLAQAFVISFTYMPQIGITSKTDIGGIKTFYEYDNSGRLSLIKDAENNILKRYIYHYASQAK